MAEKATLPDPQGSSFECAALCRDDPNFSFERLQELPFRNGFYYFNALSDEATKVLDLMRHDLIVRGENPRVKLYELFEKMLLMDQFRRLMDVFEYSDTAPKDPEVFKHAICLVHFPNVYRRLHPLYSIPYDTFLFEIRDYVKSFLTLTNDLNNLWIAKQDARELETLWPQKYVKVWGICEYTKNLYNIVKKLDKLLRDFFVEDESRWDLSIITEMGEYTKRGELVCRLEPIYKQKLNLIRIGGQHLFDQYCHHVTTWRGLPTDSPEDSKIFFSKILEGEW